MSARPVEPSAISELEAKAKPAGRPAEPEGWAAAADEAEATEATDATD